MTATETIAPPKVKDRKMLIDGKWVDSASGKTFETINPSTGDTICSVAEGDKADVDLAVKAARKALESKGWRNMAPAQRGRLLNKLADLIEANAKEIAALETLDNGKPIRETRDIDIPLVARHFYHHAGWAQLMDSEMKDYKEVGVVGQIIPWNFPLLMLA